ncbi:hypothetical protein O3M35_008652 [Rhynocoris fuscipes]|uniref:Uncharacterized protein n=1 Tax=Rhynocoris fuscipes TaxID=488301 RepID=A0AAW1D6Y7_9HEMI
MKNNSRGKFRLQDREIKFSNYCNSKKQNNSEYKATVCILQSTRRKWIELKKTKNKTDSEITDWKHKLAPLQVNQPVITEFFSSSDWKRSQINKVSLKSLKYFDNEADLDINIVKKKINQLREKIRFVKYDQYKLFFDFIKSLNYSGSIITQRSVLSRIMNTPFEVNRDRRKWIIKAEIFKNNRVHLYYEKDQELNISEEMSKQYELLKRYLFVKHPVSYYRNVTSAFDEVFGASSVLNSGSHSLYYTTEIAGVISDQEITTLQQLKATEHIYCDIFEDGEFSEDLINYNPIWWSKAILTNAKQCIIASYDKHNDCIKNIYKFNMDKFDDKTKYENLWSPDAAWNFLNYFIQFIKDSVNSIPNKFRNQCVWKFESFPNNESSVSCEIFLRKMENGKETLTPVDETTF